MERVTMADEIQSRFHAGEPGGPACHTVHVHDVDVCGSSQRSGVAAPGHDSVIQQRGTSTGFTSYCRITRSPIITPNRRYPWSRQSRAESKRRGRRETWMDNLQVTAREVDLENAPQLKSPFRVREEILEPPDNRLDNFLANDATPPQTNHKESANKTTILFGSNEACEEPPSCSSCKSKISVAMSFGLWRTYSIQRVASGNSFASRFVAYPRKNAKALSDAAVRDQSTAECSALHVAPRTISARR